ncbi:helix-turn-helix transcriptional regulator [Nonomuraea sp. SYSU D8015]|uniref:helix-turn-helix transcriptional regulator n=1 Tax=Nonomuraea sp. SYSU D8015 TaxID=2593644 RepID=UPI0016608AD0|nr:helix-turn-helix domain-containing protein [Nonomuraea sp. SYSU D8015]
MKIDRKYAQRIAQEHARKGRVHANLADDEISTGAIAELTGVDPQTVSRWANRDTFPRRRRRGVFPLDEVLEWLNKYHRLRHDKPSDDELLTLYEFARLIGVTERSVSQYADDPYLLATAKEENRDHNDHQRWPYRDLHRFWYEIRWSRGEAPKGRADPLLDEVIAVLRENGEASDQAIASALRAVHGDIVSARIKRLRLAAKSQLAIEDPRRDPLFGRTVALMRDAAAAQQPLSRRRLTQELGIGSPPRAKRLMAAAAQELGQPESS